AVRLLGERGALLAGFLFGAAGLVVFGMASTGGWFLLGVPIDSPLALTAPAIQSLMTRKVTGSEQGELQGALSSLRGITGILGPLLFTRVFATAIGGAASPRLPGAAFLL